MAYIYGVSDQEAGVRHKALLAALETLDSAGQEAFLAGLEDFGQGFVEAHLRRAGPGGADGGQAGSSITESRKGGAEVARKKKGKRAAVISKAYGGGVPVSQGRAARTCWSGHRPGKPGDRFCFTCGEPLGISVYDHQVRELRKSAAAERTPAGLLAQFRACDNSQEREMYWADYQAALTGRRPA